MSYYNSILNLFSGEELVTSTEPPPQPPPQRPPVLLYWADTDAKLNQLRALLQQVDDLGLDNDFRLLVLEGKSDSLYLDQEQQNILIRLLQDAASSTEAEQLVQNSAIALLQDGFLPRVHYEQDQLGGAHLLLTAGEQSTDAVTGLPAITPSSASLETYDAAGGIDSSVVLHGNLVTLSHNVRVEGELILNEKSVADQLLTLEDKAKQFLIEQAVSVASEAAQDALLAALALYSARPPSGYEALPEDTGGDDSDPKAVHLNPLKLYPTGVYNQLDSLGNQVGIPDVVTQGKISLNLGHDLCFHTLHMRGDLKQEHQMADDTVEFQSPCLLGSQVAAYNTQQQLTNPQAVAVKLGTNALVTVAGDVNAASLTADTVTCSTVNRVNVVRTLHAAQALSTKDYNRDIAIQSIRTSAALRLAAKPALARDYIVPLANIRGALTQVLRRVKPTMSRDFTEDIQRLRVEAVADRRELYRPLPISKDFTPDIVELKQAVLASTTHKPVVTLAADLMSRLKRLGDGLASVRRSIKPALSASYAAVIAVLKQAVALNKSDIKALKQRHDVLAPDLKPAIARARGETVAARRLIKPALSKSYDKQIAAVRQSVAAASSQSTVVSQRLIKPSLSKSYDKQIAAVRQSSVAAQRLIKPSLSKSYDKQIAAVRQSITATSSRFNTATLTLGSSASNGWLTIGSFIDSFVGTIAVTFDHASDVTYNDSLRVDITYNRTGDQIAVTATRGGNAASLVNNTNNINGLSALYITNVALNAAGTAHTVNVYYGYLFSNGTFKVGTEVKAGNFTLASPMVYGSITYSSSDRGYMDCMEGHNCSSMFMHGSTTIDSAVMDKCQVSQLTGLAQSMLNVPANSVVKVGTVLSTFQGTIRIIMSTTATLPAATHAVTLVINQIETDAKPVITMRHHANAVVRTSPSQGIQTIYFTGSSFTGVSVKTGSVGCNLYVTALNSDPLLSSGNAFNGDDGWSGEMTVITQPTGAYELTVNSNSPTVYCNDVNVLGALTTSGALTVTGNADIAGSANFQNGVTSQKALTCNSGIALSGGQLNFGSRSGSLINLFGSGLYTIGIQAGTQYCRTDQHIAWFRGGTHSDTTLDSGGGTTIAYLDGNAYEMYLRGGTGNYTKVVRSTKNIVMSGNVSAPSQSSGGINFGITFSSPPIVTLTINDAGGTVAAIYVAGVNTTGCNWSASNSGTSNRSINWIAHGTSTQ
jgi:hypothetical protein